MVAQQRAGTPPHPGLLLSGSVPPLTDWYFQRPETGVDLRSGLFPGQTVVLTHGEQTATAPAAQGGRQRRGRRNPHLCAHASTRYAWRGLVHAAGGSAAFLGRDCPKHAGHPVGHKSFRAVERDGALNRRSRKWYRAFGNTFGMEGRTGFCAGRVQQDRRTGRRIQGSSGWRPETRSRCVRC